VRFPFLDLPELAKLNRLLMPPGARRQKQVRGESARIQVFTRMWQPTSKQPAARLRSAPSLNGFENLSAGRDGCRGTIKNLSGKQTATIPQPSGWNADNQLGANAPADYSDQ
jgi:hypothetical protein